MRRIFVLCVHNKLPEALVDDRIEESEIVEANALAEDVLDDVPVHEEGTEFVLKEAQPHETTHVPEGVKAFRCRLALTRGVEAALARTERETLQVCLSFTLSVGVHLFSK